MHSISCLASEEYLEYVHGVSPHGRKEDKFQTEAHHLLSRLAPLFNFDWYESNTRNRWRV